VICRSTRRSGRPQLAAVAEWGIPASRERYLTSLKSIKQPVLVVNGSVVVLTVNSFVLQQNLPNTELILYPNSNHGSQYQYPGLFVKHVTLFVEG
jgi:pimeloyl-ACP methyl ester carboxylesterase